MKMETCRKCIRDFYTKCHNGDPRNNMEPNLYNFLFVEDKNYNWKYWWDRGILYNCIQVVPTQHPIGTSKTKELVPECPCREKE